MLTIPNLFGTIDLPKKLKTSITQIDRDKVIDHAELS